jgi:hypothetical protein
MSTPDDDPRVQAAWDRSGQAREHADRLIAISNDLSTDEGQAAFIADYEADVAGEQYNEIWHDVNAELHPELYAEQPDLEAEW